MTFKNLNRFTARLTSAIVIANGYNPETGVNGGDRELAQGDLGKALKKHAIFLLTETGLTEEQAKDALAQATAAEATELADDKTAKAEKRAAKIAA